MAKAKQITDGSVKEPAEQSDYMLAILQTQQMQFEGYMNMVREMAQNPNVDPGKLEKLLDIQERVLDRSAKQLFDAAMHKAQQEMTFITTDKENEIKHNRYATYKQLDKAVRPIYTKHGFSVSFDTGPGKPEYGPIAEGEVRILMDIAHAGGWQVQKHTDVPIETTGSQGKSVMTKTHAKGSGMSYGKRYLLIFGFNLAVGEADDDGNKAGGSDYEERPGGGKDHRFKGPQPKSRKGEEDTEREANPKAREQFPQIVRTGREGDRIPNGSLGTMRSNMKRLKVTDEQFQADFGFPLDETHKGGLNQLIDWMKEAANA